MYKLSLNLKQSNSLLNSTFYKSSTYWEHHIGATHGFSLILVELFLYYNLKQNCYETLDGNN